MRELAMMRMVCDTNYILDPDDRACPKLGELEKILEECRENDAKVIVFSEWERMLELVRDLCEQLDLGFAWHTGTRAAAPPPRGDQRVQERPGTAAFFSAPTAAAPAQPAKRQRRHQLRPALESGQARTAHRPRLAQAPDATRHGDQSRFRKHHRAPNARNPGATNRRSPTACSI